MSDALRINMKVLSHEPAEAYHAKAGEYLSSHQLLDFMKCPWLFRKKSLGLVAETETPTYLIGRAAHVRILEGRKRYEESFAFGGPVNPATGKPFGSNTKAYREWADAQGKPVLDQADVDLVENLASGLSMNPAAVDLILDGEAEGVVRAEYYGMACQVRIDWLNPSCGIVDLKTCDDLTWFESDAKRYRYVHQMAFYRAVLAKVLSGTLVPVHIVAVEKKEPYRCGVWRVGDESLAIAQRENEAAIRRLNSSLKQNRFPTGYEEVRVLDVA